MNILFIDNFDSFTFNLVDEFAKRNCIVRVFRNNTAINIISAEIEVFKPELIVLSPGPSTPQNAGNCLELIRRYHQTLPFLGVCLGHQCLVEAFHGKVGPCREIIHGKPSMIYHDGKGIFKNIGNPLQVGRYHSLAALKLPEEFETSATFNGIVMAVRHRKLPLFGVQFHPESILTPQGGQIIENILEIIS
jgi:anthranilate synthase component 2